MTKSSSYRSDVQGLRAIAVLLVLLFHFETRLKGGYLGVDMFFVISGFVIASSTLREIDRTDTFSWSAFLHRRVRRLLPGTALVACATAFVSMLLLSPFGPQKETAKMLLSAASYTSNFFLMPQNYFSLDPKANPLLHLWSLAVEEQFYFVWPLAILVLVGLRKQLHINVVKGIVWVAVIAVLVASCWFFLICSIHGSQINGFRWFGPLFQRSITPEHFAFYSPFTRAWEFVAGVVIALFLRTKSVKYMLKGGTLITLFGASAVLYGLYLASNSQEVQHDGNWSTNTTATLAVVIGTAMWILGGSNDKLLRPLISLRPLTLIGDCSYSIYLLHWPIWVLLITTIKQSNSVIALAFALSLSLGWLQFRFFEEPIRSRNKLFSTNTVHFVGAFALVAVVGFGVMSYTTPIIAMHLAGKKPDEISLHIMEKSCAGQRFESESAQTCIYPSAIGKGKAVLVGDSMAKSLSDGFVQASNSQDLDSYIFAYPGCAFLLFDSPIFASGPCSGWRADVLSAINELQPSVLIIANLSSLYTEIPLPDQSLEETRHFWGSELERTLIGLSNIHAKVIIAQPPPRFAYDLRYEISLLWPNSVKEPRAEVVGRREEINSIEQNAVAGLDFVQPILNFTDLFCNANICDPRIDGEFLFEDDDHLSVDGSFYVSDMLERAITEAFSQ